MAASPVNPRLDSLQPYPFEKLRALFKDVTPTAGLKPISFGIGEPKHPTPALIRDAVVASLDGLASYPATAGSTRCARRSPAGSNAATGCRRSTRPRRCCRCRARARRCSRSRRR
jgi:hypothetical protein